MERPSQRYREVARLLREHGCSEDHEGVPEPATAEEVSAAELALGCRFPDSYRWFQLEFGDFRHGPLDIYSVRRAEAAINIVGINLDARHDGFPRLPAHLIAFSDNGSGDFYCFDTSALEGGGCPVVWWDHAGNEAQQPQRVDPSFLDWLAAEVRERASEEKWSNLRSLASRLRAVLSFARDVLRARAK